MKKGIDCCTTERVWNPQKVEILAQKSSTKKEKLRDSGKLAPLSMRLQQSWWEGAPAIENNI